MWIAAQLGEGRIKVWVHAAHEVSEFNAPSDRGLGIEDQLLVLVGDLLPADTVTLAVCAGAFGAARVAVPAAPQAARQIMFHDSRLAVFAMPQLIQANPSDAMQGEEATIAGFIAAHPEWDGVLCITGSSTRWVHISAGEVVSFSSFLTGEMFGLLTAQSSMRDAVAGQGWQADVFDSAVADVMSRPERLSAALANIRADALLLGVDPARARAQLSGCLIGAELAATRVYWLGQNVALIGDGVIVERYGAALRAQGAMMQIHSGDEMTLRGLQDAHEKLRGS